MAPSVHSTPKIAAKTWPTALNEDGPRPGLMLYRGIWPPPEGVLAQQNQGPLEHFPSNSLPAPAVLCSAWVGVQGVPDGQLSAALRNHKAAVGATQLPALVPGRQRNQFQPRP